MKTSSKVKMKAWKNITNYFMLSTEKHVIVVMLSYMSPGMKACASCMKNGCGITITVPDSDNIPDITSVKPYMTILRFPCIVCGTTSPPPVSSTAAFVRARV